MKNYLYFSLLFSLFLFTFSLYADDPKIDIKLPYGWEQKNTTENEGTTIYYFASKENKGQAEHLGAIFQKESKDLNDSASHLKANLTELYPKAEFEIAVVDQSANSITYEWIAKEKGKQIAYGISKDISTPEGTFYLGYKTTDLSTIYKARSTWLPIIKNASSK